MKIFIFLLCLISGSTAMAQSVQVPVPFSGKIEINNGNQIVIPEYYKNIPSTGKTEVLSLDKMPCHVPYTGDIARMPVSGSFNYCPMPVYAPQLPLVRVIK